MIKYHKIETLKKRNTDGTFSNEYRNDTVKYLKDLEWVWTEKVDGTNIGVAWDGYSVSIQGRTERAQIPAELFNNLVDKFKTPIVSEIFEQIFGETPAVIFGEGYGAKIQSGGNYSDTQEFIIFDIFMPNSNCWLTRESIENIAAQLGADVVPILGTGTLDEAVRYVANKPKSKVGKCQAIIEGVVCRPKYELNDRNGKRLIVKIKPEK